MKHKPLTFIALAMYLLGAFSCYQPSSTGLSNRLTSFVTPEAVTPEIPQYRISKPTGNLVGDAKQVIAKDSRTKGVFEKLILLQQSMGTQNGQVHFQGKTKQLSTYTGEAMNQLIVVNIERRDDKSFYQLSLGSNP